MPVTRNIKCVKCNDGICKTQGSIQCTLCKSWLHMKCAEVAEKHLSLLKDLPTSFYFKCSACASGNFGNNFFELEMLSMKNDFESFVTKSQSNHNTFTETMAQILSDFKNEMSAVVSEIKSDILDCRKLINQIDSSTNKKVLALEAENNILYRNLYRGDLIISGLPSGLDDLRSVVVALGSFYGIAVSNYDINHVCYMHNRRLILVKYNSIAIRDKIMKEYFKKCSLTVMNIIGGEIAGRVYLNDHFSPTASKLNSLCRKMLSQKIISKYKIINANYLKVKLTLPDGRVIESNMEECAELFHSRS